MDTKQVLSFSETKKHPLLCLFQIHQFRALHSPTNLWRKCVQIARKSQVAEVSSCVLIRAFDVHDCTREPVPAPRCSLGSTAFEMYLLDLLSELGPALALITPPGRDTTSRHQRGDARGQLNEPVHALYTIQLATARGSTCRQQVQRHARNRIDETLLAQLRKFRIWEDYRVYRSNFQSKKLA